MRILSDAQRRDFVPRRNLGMRQSVFPEGFGSAITYTTLETARTRGYRYACIMSSAMGKPIYQRLGFNVQVNVPEYQWKKDP